MPFYREHVYHYLVAALGNPKPVQTIRQQLIPVAEGTRDILSLIKAGGVTIEQTDATYLAPFPKSGSYFLGYGTSREAAIKYGFYEQKVSYAILANIHHCCALPGCYEHR